MKLITWNVNGLRSIFGKGFQEFVRAEQPDVLLLQETKVDPATLEWDWLKGYELLWNRAQKPGYSGTGILTRKKPLSVAHGIGMADHDKEGRVVTAEFAGCYVVCVYTPNAQAELARLPYRMKWDAEFLAYLDRPELILARAERARALARPEATEAIVRACLAAGRAADA